MKKILVVLLVFAVAGGVFAQQSPWSLSGGVRLATDINVDGTDINGTKAATVWGSRYLTSGLGDNDDEPRGFLNLAYSRDGIRTGINFRVNPNTWSGNASANTAFNMYNNNGLIDVFAEYKTDKYMLYVETPFRLMLAGQNTGLGASANIARLWGYYDLLNGMVHVEAGYRGADKKWWMSDDTAYKADYWSNTQNKDAATSPSSDSYDVKRGSFLTNVKINNIEFGIMVPNLFSSFASTSSTYRSPRYTVAWTAPDGSSGNQYFYVYDGDSVTDVQASAQAWANAVINAGGTATVSALGAGTYVTTNGQPDLSNNAATGKVTTPYGAFIEGALMKSVFGVKFAMQPVGFAVQFMFEDAGVYLGATYAVNDVINVGFSFQGVMSPPVGYQVPVLAGLSLGYTNDAFFAGIKALYGVNGNVTTAGGPQRIGTPYGNYTHGVKGASALLNYADATDTTLGTRKYIDASGAWTGSETAIGIEPTFYYNVIPEYFRFRIDAGFYFRGTDIAWKVIPQITWNMLGTGANGMGGPSTAVGAKYALRNEYPKTNLFSVYFKWGF